MTGDKGLPARRVVVDTNIFVGAAFQPRSHAGQVIAGCRDGRFLLVWNRPTRAETCAVLGRIPPISAADFADLFAGSDPVADDLDETPWAFIPDRSDRKFAALAAASGSILVTNDDDLLGVAGRMPFPVMTPRALLFGDRSPG